MQNVSDEYLAALYNSYVVSSTITGTITTTSKVVYELSDSDILIGSLSINNKCVNNSSFEFGAAYQGELNVTLLNNTIDRYTLFNAEITFTEHRLLEDGSYEHISTGTFYVSEATRSKKTLTIKALDAMDWLDVDIEEDTYGTVYDLLAYAADKAGLELAQSEEEIAALPNADDESIYYLYMETVDTYRTLVMYLAMITGTFATINIDNKLELRSFATEYVATIPCEKRNNTTTSDYETYYSAVTARFIAEENYARYTYDDEGDGLELDLGDIPIVRGSSSFKHTVLENLFAKLAEIRYTPISFTLLTSDIALELGDMLAIGNEDADTIVTSFTWNYHGSESIKGVGDNPRLSAEDRISRLISSLESDVESKTLLVHTYTNTSDLEVTDTAETEVAELTALISADMTGVFAITVPFTMDCDGLVTFYQYVDDVLDDTATVEVYCQRGPNVVTLSNYFQLTANFSFTIMVTMTTGYFDSDLRELTAKVYDTSVDTTVPTATIDKATIRASLFIQGAATDVEKWDGTIKVSDTVDFSTAWTVDDRVWAAELTDEPVVDIPDISPDTGVSDTFSGVFLVNDNVYDMALTEEVTAEVTQVWDGLWGYWINRTWTDVAAKTWEEMPDPDTYGDDDSDS